MKDNKENRIYVTRPFLPPLEEYVECLEEIWENKQLTNRGLFHEKFEKALADYLNVEYLSLVNNATTGLIIAQRALGFTGEIITTPFSFVATAHSIKWNGLTPIFVDTDSFAGNLNPEKVEEAINEKTGGILAVHNYGIPGNVEGLQKVADKYSLPLIYDAAAAMGVKYKNESVLKYGQLSVMSFHATKVFTTFEGGAIISDSVNMKQKIDQMRNFSILDEEIVAGLGVNGKMNEVEASMGLLQLKSLDETIEKREAIYEEYESEIKKIDGIRMCTIPVTIEYNYAYAPIFFDNGQAMRDNLYDEMRLNNIFCRKYWYPLITHHEFYNMEQRSELNIANNMSNQVLCLPIYPDLKHSQVHRIIEILDQYFN